MTDPTETARRLVPLAKMNGKPILASWMGGESVKEAEGILHAAGIPSFKFPDAAARAFCYMWRYSRNLDALYETPALPPETDQNIASRAKVDQIVSSARRGSN